MDMADIDPELLNCEGFQWDEHNAQRIWLKHSVTPAECEQVFFNRPLLTAPDIKHSGVEHRYYSLGSTDEGRLLFVVFTVRENRIRVISARDMNRKERTEYESHEE